MIQNLFAILAGLLLAIAPATAAQPLATGDGLEPLPPTTRPVRYRIAVTPDAQWTRFDAQADLTFDVIEPTDRVIVNALGLEIRSARLANGTPARIERDDARQRIAFVFPRLLPVGRHRLDVVYRGTIGASAEGLFRVTYPTAAGERRMLFTRLCCIGAARRIAPMWDQPDMKAVFDIELSVPRGMTAVSNMPAVRTTPQDRGISRIRFAPSPKMSSYLLFFAVGDFERVGRRSGDTELAALVQQGKGGRTRSALATTADVLPYYNDYFATPYPLPKLDSVGMPGAGEFGAMENWGAIFYFEPYIAADPATITEREAQNNFEIIAHEVAHQWFGNLVTMKWWDDLWLNEGFASWMATKATDRFHPEWNMWLHAAEKREAAFRLDAGATTHPVTREIRSLGEAELAFDEITYEKGAQVVRMLEGWLGEGTFRAAIRAYVGKNAYGNARTADLVGEFGKVGGAPVAPIVDDFTRQPGVPLIEVLSTRCEPGAATTRVMLRQGRFGLDAESRAPLRWHVPVTASVVGDPRIARRIVIGDEPVALDVPGCGPVKVNVGETGYFRTRYDAASFAALRAGFAQLPLADRLGLLKDSRGLAEGGYQSFATWLDLADALPSDADPLLLLDGVRSAQEIDRLYRGLPGRARFRSFVHRRFAPLLVTIGWTAKAGEAPNTAILRDALIALLARTGHAPTLAEATRRFRGMDADPALAPAAVRKAIINAAGSGADGAVFDMLVARAAAATDFAGKRLYLLAAAGANDPAVAAQALALTATGSIPAPLQFPVMQAVAEQQPERAFDAAAADYAGIVRRAGSYAPMLMAALARFSLDTAFVARFDRFMQHHGAGGSEAARRAIATIRLNDRIRREGLPQVTAWIDRQ